MRSWISSGTGSGLTRRIALVVRAPLEHPLRLAFSFLVFSALNPKGCTAQAAMRPWASSDSAIYTVFRAAPLRNCPRDEQGQTVANCRVTTDTANI